MLGDGSRANKAFALAEEALLYVDNDDYYQTSLRDIAAMIAIASEVNNQDFLDKLTLSLANEMKSTDRMHTQEKAFLLLASAALIDKAGDIQISMNNLPAENRGKLPAFHLDATELAAGVTLTNVGASNIYRNVSMFGVSKIAPEAVDSGYKISKKYFNLQGEPIDLNSLQQNDRVIVQINATPEDYQTHPTMIVDMLPAGFEIETLLTTEDAGKQGVYSWLGDLTEAQVAEARDDRYVAAIDLTVSTYNNYYRGCAGTANLAYVARVVTPGEFSLPGVFVEDMYRPGVTSHTDVSRITIEPAQ